MSKQLTILVATANAGKLTEIKALLKDLPVKIVTPGDVLGKEVDVDETGKTFSENALLKAQTLAEKTSLSTIADDSGLCVEAIDGQPGVLSRRFIPGTDQDRNLHILKLLQRQNDRRAYFESVICFFDPRDSSIQYFKGRVDGMIATAEKGENGFGYDPIFVPDGFMETFAELGEAVKNKVSHRARAILKFREYLVKSLAEKNAAKEKEIVK